MCFRLLCVSSAVQSVIKIIDVIYILLFCNFCLADCVSTDPEISIMFIEITLNVFLHVFKLHGVFVKMKSQCWETVTVQCKNYI
jgi:hypothetical protein